RVAVPDRRTVDRRTSGQGRVRLLRQAHQRGEGRHQGRRQDVQGRDQVLRRSEQRQHVGAAIREVDQRGQGQSAARSLFQRYDVRGERGRREVPDTDGRRAFGVAGDLRTGL